MTDMTDGTYTCIVDCPRHCTFTGLENRISDCPRFPQFKNSIIFINDIDNSLPKSMREAYNTVFKKMCDNHYMAHHPKDDWEESCKLIYIADASSCQMFLSVLTKIISSEDWRDKK